MVILKPFRAIAAAGIVMIGSLGSLSEAAIAASGPERYDIVIAGARAIDPETGLDARRNIAIRKGRIAAITTRPLVGRLRIDGAGLVVAPGFIDLHSHAVSLDAARFEALDGVTTRLELELGVYPVAAWYAGQQARSLINYGASASHTIARYKIQSRATKSPNPVEDYEERIREPLDTQQVSEVAAMLEKGIDEGAIGIGSGTQYAPGISRSEMLAVTAAAARHRMCVFTHIRFGSLVEPGSTLEAVQENVANAAFTGACVHIVHLNSMAMSSTPDMLKLLHGARERGIDVSTEIYPWDASNDRIRSVIFDPGWEARWGVKVGDLQSKATGKRLTQAEFDALRTGKGDDGVLMHMNSEATIDTAIRDPLVLVASDALEIPDRLAHPRSAGTFARVLGRYVRERGTISLMEALRKMSLMPAQRLEKFVPAMRKKGRLQVGMDADLVVFDPARVAARADYLDARQGSIGMRLVLVGGIPVVRDEQVIEGVLPGQPIRSAALEPK